MNLNYGPIDEWVAKLQYMYLRMPSGERKELVRAALAALFSFPRQPLDIKERLPGTTSTGYQYDGYWMSTQSAGNRLAGKNAAIVGMPWTTTIVAAGALHIRSNRSVGSLRYLGETDYAGRQIRSGYNSIKR